MLALLAGAAATLTLGPAVGNPATISSGGSAKTGLDALEQSGIGPGPLTPIEILTPRSEAAGLAHALSRLPGVRGAADPATTSWHRGPTAVVDVFTHDNTVTTLASVRNTAHAFKPGIRVGGIDAQNRDFISAVYGHFPLMIADRGAGLRLARPGLPLPAAARQSRCPQRPQRRRNVSGCRRLCHVRTRATSIKLSHWERDSLAAFSYA